MDGATVTSRPAAEMKLSFSPPPDHSVSISRAARFSCRGAEHKHTGSLESHSAASQHVAHRLMVTPSAQRASSILVI
ncbi:hypothetical protein F7725_017854 [Dissostichus mawsoni]|uniref:Uncharacterized protein n=1 Tax=Dissostichus mawsoni TaxID=36200 RepID=A0A7J5XRE4_DISMA|nr:hypothetical protein F7725_017854 [Dissostichus mawsoni]